MIQLNYTAEQYKQLTIGTLKDKLYLFLLGSFVSSSFLVGAMYYANINPVTIAQNTIQEKVLKMQNYPKVSLNIDNISNQIGEQINHIQAMGGGYIPKMTQNTGTIVTPSQNVQKKEDKKDNKKQPTKVVEQGQTSSTKTEKAQPRPDTYTLQEGDSLASVAEKFFGDSNAWTMIAKENNIKNPDLIDVGMKLKIPKK